MSVWFVRILHNDLSKSWPVRIIAGFYNLMKSNPAIFLEGLIAVGQVYSRSWSLKPDSL